MISVDTKKKELVGPFKNPGRCWRRRPHRVFTHDFAKYAKGQAIPYGIYDLAHNDGFVVVGTSHETPSFAEAAIRRWWLDVGRQRYGNETPLLIEVDGGESAVIAGAGFSAPVTVNRSGGLETPPPDARPSR